MSEGYPALTEKEKQTLRLMVRGFDAKSIANQFNLSVHTVNERLRNARRKMAVSSSREAARLLLKEEGDALNTYNSFGSKEMGEAKTTTDMRDTVLPNDGQPTRHILALAIGGIIIMSLVLTALALASMSHNTAMTAESAETTKSEARTAGVAETQAVQSARNWLSLVDKEKWSESWDATGQSFKKLNSSKVWANVSEKVRAPLGAVSSRQLISQENVPSPPNGVEVIKFKTSFANKATATETVSLVRENGEWKVVGYYIS